MNGFEKVVKQLHTFNIPFDIVEHPPALSTEEADSFIEGIEGVRTKSMFLTNKKKTAYYLVILDGSKLMDVDKFKEIVGENRIKMASADSLMEKMSLPPGVVSIFGLLNNTEQDIHVFFDEDILSEKRMSFHPNVNTKTIFLDTTDVFAFVHKLGFEYEVIEM